MRCVNCEAEIPEGEKFCPQCGVPVGTIAKCRHCGAPLLTGDRFCGQCGRDVNEPPAAAQATPAVVAEGASPAVAVPAPPPPPPVARRKRSPWLWVLIVVVVLVVAGCGVICGPAAVAVLIATPTPAPTPTFTPTPIPTPTPVPTFTPTPIAYASTLRVEDDFTVLDETRWQNSDLGDVLYAPQDGQYAIRVATAHWMAWNGLHEEFADFQVEFETTLVEGDALNSSGIFFRYQDEDHFYSLDINGDGDYTVGKEVDGEWQDVVPWQASPALRPAGEPNLIRLIAFGDRFTLYINGELVDEFVDGDYDTGDIALHAKVYDDPPVRATFDNLQIWDVEER